MKLVKISIRTTPATLDIQGNGLQNTLRLEREKGSFEIRSTKPRVQIDQRACFAEAGRKGMTDFRQDMISYAQSVLTRGIARIIDQGNEAIAIQYPQDVVAEQADYNAFGMFEQEFGYGTMPSSRPTITVDRGTLNYSYQPDRLVNKTQRNELRTTYQRGRVEFCTY